MPCEEREQGWGEGPDGRLVEPSLPGCDCSRITSATCDADTDYFPMWFLLLKFDAIIICPRILLQGFSRTEAECLSLARLCLLPFLPATGCSTASSCRLPCAHRGQLQSQPTVPRSLETRPVRLAWRVMGGFILLPRETTTPSTPYYRGKSSAQVGANTPQIRPSSEQGARQPMVSMVVADGDQLRLFIPCPRRQTPCSQARAAQEREAALSGCGWPGWSSVCVYACQGKVPCVRVGCANPTTNPPAWDRGGGGSRQRRLSLTPGGRGRGGNSSNYGRLRWPDRGARCSCMAVAIAMRFGRGRHDAPGYLVRGS